MKVVIVGGVAGGATAAARLRRLDEQAQIIMFEKGEHISFANCGLPYYIGGTIKGRTELLLQTPQSFKARFNVDTRVSSEVLSLDRAAKTVLVRDQKTGARYEESYDKLILAPGAQPTIPSLPGMDDPRVFALHTVADTDAIKAFIDAEQPRHAVVVGGGYIGVEMAENLVRAGLTVTIVQRPRHLINPLDFDMACQVHEHLRGKGVDLRLGAIFGGVSEGPRGLRVMVDDDFLPCDMVVLAVGVHPDNRLAVEAGLPVGAKGGIIVDVHMRTSDADIYAVGDAVQVTNRLTDQPALIPLAGPANKQGRIAADHICGIPSAYAGTQGSAVLKAFDLTIATCGLNEKAAGAAGIAYDKVYLSPASHAGYYPGGSLLTLKLLFAPETGRILGAQAVGYEGVDKRMDVLAVAIRARMTAADLTELELCYAPPYSSAKDPVNMAGYLIENVRAGLVRQFYWQDVEGLPRDGSAQLIDVRTAGEFARGHLEGFANIPVDELRERMGKLDPGKPVYLICQSALRSYLACRILTQHGFIASHLAGGLRLYHFANKA